MTIASPPALRISAAASSQAGFLRDDTTTLAPCRARCRAIDLPMPLLEPVTTATLPVRSKSGDAMKTSSVDDRLLCGMKRDYRKTGSCSRHVAISLGNYLISLTKRRPDCPTTCRLNCDAHDIHGFSRREMAS